MINQSVAISVRNVSKTFVIPHERINTMRGAFVSLFKNKNYESFKALDNISFDVRQGEFVGIIGKNGSGKSTLLRILAGIYQPDRGKVQIHGQISPFLELGIGFNPELSGRDNIYLNGILLGLTKKEIDKKFDEIVAFSELERFIDQKLKNYSSGMQVRLAFSVAIFANRDILLLDEVMAVGDMAFKEKSFQKIWEFHTQGKTIILVTHDSDVVTQYCDTAILLSEGKMLVKGDPQQAINIYTHMS
jgi:ABC-2 type transport system ATP-binding protein